MENLVTDGVRWNEELSTSTYSIQFVIEKLYLGCPAFKDSIQKSTLADVSYRCISGGNGYFSHVYKVEFTFEDATTLSVAIKVPTTNLLENMEDFSEAHNCECKFFSLVQNHADIPVPQAFYIEESSEKHPGCIIMQDLSDNCKGISVRNYVTAELCFDLARVLARLQAGLAAIGSSKWKGVFKNDDFVRTFYEKCYQSYIPEKAIQCGLKADLIEKCQILANTDFSKFATKGIAEKYDIISMCHGDCHSNNMLFYKNPDNSVTNSVAVLIDWQTAYDGNPLCDLGRFMASAPEGNTRRSIEMDVLDTYYNTLCEEYRKRSLEVPFTRDVCQTLYDYAFLQQVPSCIVMPQLLFNLEDSKVPKKSSISNTRPSGNKPQRNSTAPQIANSDSSVDNETSEQTNYKALFKVSSGTDTQRGSKKRRITRLNQSTEEVINDFDTSQEQSDPHFLLKKMFETPQLHPNKHVKTTRPLRKITIQTTTPFTITTSEISMRRTTVTVPEERSRVILLHGKIPLKINCQMLEGLMEQQLVDSEMLTVENGILDSEVGVVKNDRVGSEVRIVKNDMLDSDVETALKLIDDMKMKILPQEELKIAPAEIMTVASRFSKSTTTPEMTKLVKSTSFSVPRATKRSITEEEAMANKIMSSTPRVTTVKGLKLSTVPTVARKSTTDSTVKTKSTTAPSTTKKSSTDPMVKIKSTTDPIVKTKSTILPQATQTTTRSTTTFTDKKKSTPKHQTKWKSSTGLSTTTQSTKDSITTIKPTISPTSSLLHLFTKTPKIVLPVNLIEQERSLLSHLLQNSIKFLNTQRQDIPLPDNILTQREKRLKVTEDQDLIQKDMLMKLLSRFQIPKGLQVQSPEEIMMNQEVNMKNQEEIMKDSHIAHEVTQTAQELSIETMKNSQDQKGSLQQQMNPNHFQTQQGQLELQKDHLESQKGHLGLQKGHLEPQNGLLEPQKGHLGLQKGHLEPQNGLLEPQKDHQEQQQAKTQQLQANIHQKDQEQIANILQKDQEQTLKLKQMKTLMKQLRSQCPSRTLMN
ncbi:unnamed protein product [Bursaphelenchus okinawaensis]|uniref:CHK kinase-like domain-containing protein n=1 Tax=Bursaphelenchus okinawaensis TaxID=465554 RepID=A0A811KZA7_9BILA|nr:unnamed protein product [Bursaphelenchus okinawaensis]CAG9115009.1 unnamed protein product [Bursaphelenchus okinawaensis]